MKYWAIFCGLMFLNHAWAGVELPDHVSAGNKQVSKISLGDFLKTEGGPLTPRESKALTDRLRSMIGILKDSMYVPKEISVIYAPEVGVQKYEAGNIWIHLPFSAVDDQGRVSKKTLDQSLPLLIHEVAHHIFESHIYSISLNQKTTVPVIWSFFTAGDPKLEPQSRNFIETTKDLAGMRSRSTDELLKLYFSIASQTDFLLEFFADAIAVFEAKDPDAIYNSIVFPGLNDEMARFRRFDDLHKKLSLAEIELTSGSAYDVTYIARNYLWREVMKPILSTGRTKDLGKFSEQLSRALVSTLAKLTKDFSEEPAIFDSGKGSYIVERINRTLIQSFCEVFNSPRKDITLEKL